MSYKPVALAAGQQTPETTKKDGKQAVAMVDPDTGKISVVD